VISVSRTQDRFQDRSTAAQGQPAPRSLQRLPLPATAARSAGDVAVVVMVDFERQHRVWAWSRLVLQARPLRQVVGLEFAKVLGSGEGGGFGLRPSATHQGLFLGFDTEDNALEFVRRHPLLVAYRQRARAWGVLGLRASSSRGSWSGCTFAATANVPARGPVAVLTRASIRLGKARAFWGLSPASEASLARAPGCCLAMGLGEAPLIRQATFSLWQSTAAMEAYAHSGAHLQAIRAAYGGGHFSETMFVRFAPVWGEGVWNGVDLACAAGAVKGDAGAPGAPCVSAARPQRTQGGSEVRHDV
jgi:hypothetical protein